MNQRRVIINLKPAGWLSWLVLALLAIPLLVLSFFFVAFAMAAAAVLIVVGLARYYWLRHSMRSGKGSSTGSRPTDVIDVEPVDVSDASDADSATPLNTLPPRLP
ncbi:MAG: hypothetical protein ACREBN_06815 [Burkholderiaceae bacterium]